jgi:hypothetical protein
VRVRGELIDVEGGDVSEGGHYTKSRCG